MVSRVDQFVKLPESVVHKVGYALARERSKLPFRAFETMTPDCRSHSYFSTMELVRASDTPNVPYLAKAYINRHLEVEGYKMVCVVPEKAILDDFGYKSRQRYWGFIEI